MDQTIPEDVRKQVTELSQWIDEQDHLPNKIDERLARRFLHCCYYDLEKAKATAQLFFSIRASATEVLTNRDPEAESLQKFLKIQHIVLYRISGNRNLWISQLNDPGLYNFDSILDAKFLLLYTDCYILEDTFLQEADVLIMDMKDVSFKFIWKVNFSIMRKISRYQQEAMPLRLKEIHLVNTPAAMDAIYRFMKRFVHQDMADKIHFHKPNTTTLYDYFSKEDLPQDFGGTRRTIADVMTDTLAMLSRNRHYFLEGDLWRREENTTKKETLKESDFRTLAID